MIEELASNKPNRVIKRQNSREKLPEWAYVVIVVVFIILSFIAVTRPNWLN